MNYYIISKLNNFFSIKIKTTDENINIKTSHSLNYYFKIIKYQLINIFKDYLKLENIDNKIVNTIDIIDNSIFNNYDINNILNIYEYICKNKIINTSKFNYKPNTFFIFIEIFKTFNILDNYNEELNIYNLGFDLYNIRDCVSTIKNINKINIFDLEQNKLNIINIPIHIIIVDFKNTNDTNNYIYKILTFLYFLFNNDCDYLIIKLENIFYNYNIELLFILCNFFDKTKIIKPYISNILEDDKYIVCKKFIKNIKLINNLNYELLTLLTNWSSITNKGNICSIIDLGLSLFFINKIEEMNTIIGHFQLEQIYQIINIIKNNQNIEENIENIKNMNIIKCIRWCDKFQISTSNVF